MDDLEQRRSGVRASTPPLRAPEGPGGEGLGEDAPLHPEGGAARPGQGLRRLGLSPAEFDILDTLAAREGLTQQDLADALLVTKGNMTYHLCRMEERGLVDRRPEGGRTGST